MQSGCLPDRDSKEDVALRIAQCQLVEKGNNHFTNYCKHCNFMQVNVNDFCVVVVWGFLFFIIL